MARGSRQRTAVHWINGVVKRFFSAGTFAFFEAQLAPGVVLSTSRAAPEPVTAWGVPVWLDPAPAELRRGEPFGLEYAYRSGAGHLRVRPAVDHPLR